MNQNSSKLVKGNAKYIYFSKLVKENARYFR